MERDGSALTTRNPQVFFQVLRDCGACAFYSRKLTPCLAFRPLPGGSGNRHGYSYLNDALNGGDAGPQVDVRFATLCHDLGKGLTHQNFGRVIMVMARRVLS